ncbi:MAG: glycosyltransferase [Thermoleophilaceae bacterium]
MITFAVVGRNEAALLENAVEQALEAAEPGERVLFVDSGSSDDSAAVAAASGVEVLSAPRGKGRAIAAVLECCETSHLCLIDADIQESEVNIPLTLAGELRHAPADMLVGEFDWPEKRFLATTVAVYEPLMAALFPDGAGRFGHVPLSGFRLLNTRLALGRLPLGFALEAYLNARVSATGNSFRLVQLGRYRGPVRDKKDLGREVADALLDLAQELGRLDASRRPEWERWLEEALAVVRARPGPDEPADGYRERLVQISRRPPPDG